MFGPKFVPEGDENGIYPATSKTGIKIMSMNLLLPAEDSAVIWRGPMLSGAVKQLWEQVYWGKLDYLIIDLPPGTADIPLTVLQALPVSGVVMVSSPQELVGMVVRKALHLTTTMNKPILGVVENMSYYMCPDTGKKHEVFGPSRAEDMAKSLGTRVLATLPIDPALAKASDTGTIEDYYSAEYELLGKRFAEVVANR
jgi:Mrp family chromosome partitioning ATPase